LQATKINAALMKSESPIDVLSPRQAQWHQTIEAILAQNKSALAEFTFPQNPAQLADYTRRLNAKLAELK
jgi:hypothetical protein